MFSAHCYSISSVRCTDEDNFSFGAVMKEQLGKALNVVQSCSLYSSLPPSKGRTSSLHKNPPERGTARTANVTHSLIQICKRKDSLYFSVIFCSNSFLPCTKAVKLLEKIPCKLFLINGKVACKAPT